MKTIFDRETEIGVRDQDWPRNGAASNGNGDADTFWRIYAHTKACLTRAKGMLKIEQRCFVRQGQEVSEYPSIKPDMLLEPADETEEQSVAMVERIHRDFTERARQQIADGCPA